MKRLVGFLFVTVSVMILAGEVSADGTWTVMSDLSPMESINRSYIDDGGCLWMINYYEGVYRYDGESCRVMTREDGITTDSVSDIAGDDDGNIWILSRKGLYRYDGVSWENIGFGASAYCNIMSRMAIDKRGTVWCGVFCHLLRYYGDRWKRYDTSDGLPADSLNTDVIVASPDGRVCAKFYYNDLWRRQQSDERTYVYDGISWKATYTVQSHKKIYDMDFITIICSPDGEFIANKIGSGLYRLDGYEWKKLTGVSPISTASLMFDSYGTLWAVSYRGVSFFDGERWREYTSDDGMPCTTVYSIAAASDGSILMTTNKGIVRYEPDLNDVDVWKRNVVTKNPVPRNVGYLFPTSDGSLYAAANWDGVFRLDGEAWIGYNEDDGLPSSNILDADLSIDNHLWIATKNGVAAFDGLGWTTYTADDGLSGNWIASISAAPNGTVGAAVYGKGVGVFDGKTWRVYDSADGLIYGSEGVELVAAGPDGTMWAASKTGVSRYNGFDWLSYGEDDGIQLYRPSLRFLEVGPNGNVWFGTYENGLYRFNGSMWMVHDCIIPQNETTGKGTISFGLNGDVWIGIEGGVSKFDGRTWVDYGPADGLSAGVVNDIALAPDGCAWIATTKGISCFDGESWVTYNLHDGLNGRNIQSVAIDHEGQIWCGETGAISLFTGAQTVGVERTDILPQRLALHGAYPNPFNSSTFIRFELAEQAMTELIIYTITGQKIRTLINGSCPAGLSNTVWNGLDDSGAPVASGIYMIALKAGGHMVSTRMTYMK